MHALRQAKEIIRKEGLRALLRRSGRLLRESMHYAGAFRRVRAFRQDASIDEMLDFVFHDAHGVFTPLQVRSELKALAQRVQKEAPKVVVEIGTARGGSLFMLARSAAPDARIVSVDLPGGPYGGGYSELRIPLYRAFMRTGQTIRLVRGNSHDPSTLELTRKALGGQQADFLFIDGDHSYEGVRADFETYQTLVRPGGTIAFHDIAPHPQRDTNVDRFWAELKQKSAGATEIIEDRAQGWGGIGLITKASPSA